MLDYQHICRLLQECILVLLVIFCSTPVQSDCVMKWVDANGEVHYGDQPPAGADTTEIVIEESVEQPLPPTSPIRSSGQFSDFEIKINIRKRKIIQYQDEIEQIEIARDNDVAELIEQVKRYSIDHPEFVHDHAISIQIHNIKIQAQNDIDYIKRRIKKLQCEIGEIREDHDTK